MSNKKEAKKLDIHGFGKACAIVFGINSFLFAFLPALGFNVLWWNHKSLAVMSAFFPGMSPTFFGALLGLVWGVVSGAIFGMIISWFYNKLSQ